jgi:hypothetical protein
MSLIVRGTWDTSEQHMEVFDMTNYVFYNKRRKKEATCSSL